MNPRTISLNLVDILIVALNLLDTGTISLNLNENECKTSERLGGVRYNITVFFSTGWVMHFISHFVILSFINHCACDMGHFVMTHLYRLVFSDLIPLVYGVL